VVCVTWRLSFESTSASNIVDTENGTMPKMGSRDARTSLRYSARARRGFDDIFQPIGLGQGCYEGMSHFEACERDNARLREMHQLTFTHYVHRLRAVEGVMSLYSGR